MRVGQSRWFLGNRAGLYKDTSANVCVSSQSVPSLLSLVCVLQVAISLTRLPAHSPLVCVPSAFASLSPSASLPLSLSRCWCFSEK